MAKAVNTVTGALAALALGYASPAVAIPGNGIRLGGSDGRLHPYVEVEGRYDSNVLYSPDTGAQIGDEILHVRPGFDLTVPGDDTSVDLHGALDWAQYLGDQAELSRMYGEAALGIGLNRRGVLGLELSDAFRRGTTTTSLTLGSAAIANRNVLDLAIPWRPGGGALAVTVGGEWQLESFDPYLDGTVCDVAGAPGVCDASRLAKLGYNQLGASADVRWKFLPRTAAVLAASWFARDPDDRTVSVAVSGVRVKTGVTGLVTARLAGTLEAGYGQTYGDVTVRTWLAEADLEYLLTETSSLRIGYLHDVGIDPGWSFSVYQSHRAYLDGKMLLAGRYTAALRGEVDHRTYESVTTASATLARIEPSVEAEVTRWLRAAVGYAYTVRASDLPASLPSAAGFDYSKNELWVRFTTTY